MAPGDTRPLGATKAECHWMQGWSCRGHYGSTEHGTGQIEVLPVGPCPPLSPMGNPWKGYKDLASQMVLVMGNGAHR